MGFVFRVEHRLLLALEQVTGCKAEPCFITQTEFEEQMARLTMFPIATRSCTKIQDSKANGNIVATGDRGWRQKS
jgi:hypothetical protein